MAWVTTVTYFSPIRMAALFFLWGFSITWYWANIGEQKLPRSPPVNQHTRTTTMLASMLHNNSTAIICLDDQPTAAARATIRNLVADGTKVTYNQEHLKLILYRYDLNADEYICDEVLDAFHKAHDKDQEDRRTKQNRRHLRECI